MKSSLLMLTAGSLIAFAACQPQPAQEEVPQVEEIETEPAMPQAPMTDTMMQQPMDTAAGMPADTMPQM